MSASAALGAFSIGGKHCNIDWFRKIGLYFNDGDERISSKKKNHYCVRGYVNLILESKFSDPPVHVGTVLLRKVLFFLFNSLKISHFLPFMLALILLCGAFFLSSVPISFQMVLMRCV